MPNHCDQTVTITGPRALISQLHEGLKSEQVRFCDLISPMPFEMWGAPEVTMPKPFETTFPAWYEWRNENWGTKWDVCHVEIDDFVIIADRDVRTLEFKCWTAWSPPIPVWDRLVDLGCTVEAEYRDEGDMFEGTYKDGLDECWIPEDDMGDEDEAWEPEEDMNLDKDVYEEDV